MRGRRLSPVMTIHRHPPSGSAAPSSETEAGLALYRASTPLLRLNRDMHLQPAARRVRRVVRACGSRGAGCAREGWASQNSYAHRTYLRTQ